MIKLKPCKYFNLKPFIFVLLIRNVWVTLNPLKDYPPKNSPLRRAPEYNVQIINKHTAAFLPRCSDAFRGVARGVCEAGLRQDKGGIFNPIWRLRVAISHAGSGLRQLHSHRPSETLRTVPHSYALLIPPASLLSLQNYVLPQTNMQRFISANTLSDLQIAPAHVWVSPPRLPQGSFRRRLASSTIHSNVCPTPQGPEGDCQQLRPRVGITSFRLKDAFMLYSVSSVLAKTWYLSDNGHGDSRSLNKPITLLLWRHCVAFSTVFSEFKIRCC